MSFTISIPGLRPAEPIQLGLGQSIFVLGANGAGKSSLMHRIYASHRQVARRIAAHRQTWLSSGAASISANDRRSLENNISAQDASHNARWMEHYAEQRATVALYDLLDAENIRARAITRAVDAGNMEAAREAAKAEAPITCINRLLRLANIPIRIAAREGEQLVAQKGPAEYSIAELSDGERNALLLAANVLTVKPGTLLVIDEPERHLHRNIISPLLTLLFAQRLDCAFVISTHDVALTIDHAASRVVLIRGCVYQGNAVKEWDADLIPVGGAVDDATRAEVLGSRRRIVFVEGAQQSLDTALYALLFPDVSVICRGNCREVELAVAGIRSTEAHHWVRAYGIVDNDNRTAEDVAQLRTRGIFALRVHSVESIYYHPEVQRAVAQRHSQVTGQDPNLCLEAAKVAALTEIRSHTDRLARRSAEAEIRQSIIGQLPGQPEIQAGGMHVITLDMAAVVARRTQELQAAIGGGDLARAIAGFPVRETGALASIAQKLGFRDRSQYEGAVRKAIADNPVILATVRSLLAPLTSELGISESSAASLSTTA